MSFGKRFGQFVRKKRRIEGMSQEELALKVYGDPGRKTAVSQLENGHVSNPQSKTVDSYVVALNISERDLNEALGKFPRYVENLTDMFETRSERGLHIEVAAYKDGGLVVLTDGEIKKPIRRLEYFVQERELIFVGIDGMRRGFGRPLDDNLAPHMTNYDKIELFKVNKSIEDRRSLGKYKLLVICDSS